MITLGQTAYQPSTRMPPTSGRWAGWDWNSLYQGVLTAIQYPVNTLNYVRALDYITNLPKIMVFNYPILLAAWVRFTKLYPTHNHAAALRYMEALLRQTGRFQDTADKAKWWMIEQEWQSLEGAAPQIRGLSGFPFGAAGRTRIVQYYPGRATPRRAPSGYQWRRSGTRQVMVKLPRPAPRGYRPKRLSIRKPVARVRRRPAVAVRRRAATRPVTRARVVRRRAVRQPIKWMTWPIRPRRVTAPRPPLLPSRPQPPKPPPMPEPQPPPMPAGLGQTLPYIPEREPGQIILPVIIPPPPSLYPGPPTQLRKRHKWLAWIGFLGLVLLHEEPAAGSLLSGRSIKKNGLGYAVTPKERKQGMKLMYFLKLKRRRKPVSIGKKSFEYWKDRTHEATVYATYAYSAAHGREMIVKGQVKPYTGEIHRPEEAHITEAGKVKPLYSMTHTELVNTPFKTRVELPSYISWMIDKSKPDEYNYERQFRGKLPYKMRGNLYSWLVKNRDGVKGGRHEGQFSLKLKEGTLNFYIPGDPYAQVRLWIDRYSLWRDAVSTTMQQGIPLRGEVVSEYREHIERIKSMLSERPTSPEAPEMRTQLSKMESSLSLYEGKLERAREIRERARREVQEALRKPEPPVRPEPVEPPRPAKMPEPEQLRLFGNRTSFKLSDPSPMMSKDWIAAQIQKAVEEDPGRRVHGDTRYNAFFITPEREIVPFDNISVLRRTDPAMDTISVHSHSGNNWKQYISRTGNLEPFNPLNDMDIKAFQHMVLHGMANTDVLIMADGRMEVLHVPPESQDRFTALHPQSFRMLSPTHGQYATVWAREGKQRHEVDRDRLKRFAERHGLVYLPDERWLPPEPEPFIKEKPSGIRKTFTAKPIKRTKTRAYYISPYYVEPGVYPGIPEQMEMWRKRPPVQQRLLGSNRRAK